MHHEYKPYSHNTPYNIGFLHLRLQSIHSPLDCRASREFAWPHRSAAPQIPINIRITFNFFVYFKASTKSNKVEGRHASSNTKRVLSIATSRKSNELCWNKLGSVQLSTQILLWIYTVVVWVYILSRCRGVGRSRPNERHMMT